MVLEFKFKYLSKNKTFGKFLDLAAKKSSCEYKIVQKLDFIYLYIKCSQESLSDFSNSLSLYLPMSIFYYDVSVNPLDELPNVQSMSLEQDNLISFCPTCLKAVEDEKSKDYYNAFKSCEICDSYKEANFILDNHKVNSSKELFENLAEKINENKKIKIKTLSGTFVFSKLKDLDSSENLLATNLVNISSLVVENRTDIVSLACIEKPSIDFKINEIYKLKNQIKKDFINIRFANDLTLYFLCTELSKLNINFLNIENKENEFDIFLDIEEKTQTNKVLDIPLIKCFENKKFILKSNSYDKSLDVIYSKFEEKNKSQFMTVLAENELFDKSIVNFYISTKDDDGLSFYSQKFDGLIDIVKPFYIPNSIEQFFETMKNDETSSRLLQNYKEKFEDDYNEALKSDISSYKTKSFYNYWKIAKQILCFKEDILENANKCMLEKGPRIDYKLVEDEKLYNREFDYVKLIKSAMSFKLAGVDEETISLGFIESLAHFIGYELDNINSSYDLDGVSLCGDMFRYDIFTALVEKSITKNFNIYYNKEFVIQK
ncbi:hypothetical protein [Arcobacter sp. YIC-310]|uniref:hypothetical protein n=1 Tax=Arcobacter sp. YIC-310 TaxID=3376632 RepID=UPI003C1FFAB2